LSAAQKILSDLDFRIALSIIEKGLCEAHFFTKPLATAHYLLRKKLAIPKTAATVADGSVVDLV